jgi:hypothetical protein
MTNNSRTHEDPRAEARQLKKSWSVVGCVLVALALRLIHYQQSLWCDEQHALLQYICGSWSKILAPGAQQYEPNDHVLFTLLAKLCFSIGGGSSRDLGSPVVAGSIRLPSLLAGALVPIALAWPMRKRAPRLAVLVALLAAINPWLIAFSDEARGYSLMILLGIIATNLLPDDRRRWPILYSIIMSAAIYTVQLAGMLLIAHGLLVMLLRRHAIGAWVRGVILVVCMTMLLLLPMAQGLSYYYQHPLKMTADVADLANQLPRFAFAGQYVPDGLDPLVDRPDARAGIIYLLIPVVLIAIGSKLAWKNAELKLPLAVMATATLLLFCVSLFNPESAQVRFAPWCAIWLIVSISAIALWLQRHWKTPVAVVAIAVTTGWFVYRDILLLPSQPVREAMMQADAIVPTNTPIMMALLTANDSARIYQNRTIHRHEVIIANGPGDVVNAERTAIERTGHLPWVILSYEYMPHDLSPGFWDYFQSRYELQMRLPGRISAVAIYKPRGS